MNTKEYRTKARNILSNKWHRCALLFFAVSMICGVLGISVLITEFFSVPQLLPIDTSALGYELIMYVPSGFGWILTVLAILGQCMSTLAIVGEYNALRKLAAGHKPSLKDFFPFKRLIPVLIMNLLRSLILTAGIICFIIPGIMLFFAYSKADYIMACDDSIGPIAALQKSRAEMRGLKVQLFSLEISFVGWSLLLMLAEEIVTRCLVDMGWVGELLACYISWFLLAYLSVYFRCTLMLFFEQAEYVHQATPNPQMPGEETTVQSSNYDEAEKLYKSHRCSLNELKNAGLYETYQNCNVDTAIENSWRNEYVRTLMWRFDSDASEIQPLLLLIEEYSLDDLMDRVIARTERFKREGALTHEDLSRLCSQIASCLNSEAFAADEGFRDRKLTQLKSILEED